MGLLARVFVLLLNCRDAKSSNRLKNMWAITQKYDLMFLFESIYCCVVWTRTHKKYSLCAPTKNFLCFGKALVPEKGLHHKISTLPWME